MTISAPVTNFASSEASPDQRGHGWQADEGIIAQLADAFQRHVAGALDGPFVVLFEQHGADEADDGVLVREDADDVGAPLDLAVEALDRVGECAAWPDASGKVM
jgi:hypothetical protein